MATDLLAGNVVVGDTSHCKCVVETGRARIGFVVGGQWVGGRGFAGLRWFAELWNSYGQVPGNAGAKEAGQPRPAVILRAALIGIDRISVGDVTDRQTTAADPSKSPASRLEAIWEVIALFEVCALLLDLSLAPAFNSSEIYPSAQWAGGVNLKTPRPRARRMPRNPSNSPRRCKRSSTRQRTEACTTT